MRTQQEPVVVIITHRPLLSLSLSEWHKDRVVWNGPFDSWLCCRLSNICPAERHRPNSGGWIPPGSELERSVFAQRTARRVEVGESRVWRAKWTVAECRLAASVSGLMLARCRTAGPLDRPQPSLMLERLYNLSLHKPMKTSVVDAAARWARQTWTPDYSFRYLSIPSIIKMIKKKIVRHWGGFNLMYLRNTLQQTGKLCVKLL